MAKAKKTDLPGRPPLGERVLAAAEEMLAHAKGELDLPVHKPAPEMDAARVRAIRRKYAKSPKEFELRFGVPARTIEGWEQGRAIDAAGRVLLTIIDREPDAAERALA